MALLTVYETARAADAVPLLGEVHLAWLALGGAVCAFSVRAYRAADGAGRRRILRVLAASLFLDEGLKAAAVLLAGYPEAEYLPLHLCSLAMFVSLAYALRPSDAAGEFLFAVCLPGAAGALLFPGFLALPADSLLSFHSFSYHILAVCFAILPLSAGEFCPSVRRLPGCALALLAMLPPVYALNLRYGTNFFFLNAAGTENPIAWLGGGIGALAVLAALVWGALYGISAAVRIFGEKKRRAALDKRAAL